MNPPKFPGEEEYEEIKEEIREAAESAIDAMRAAMMDVARNVDIYAPFEYFLQTESIIFEPDIVAATDGNRFYVGIPFLAMSPEERRFVVIHELWHIIAGDSFRVRSRDRQIWNMAADLLNNDYILKQNIEGIKISKGALHDPKYTNMIREALYDDLHEMCREYGYIELMGEKILCNELKGRLKQIDLLADDIIPNNNIDDEETVKKRIEKSFEEYEKKLSEREKNWLDEWMEFIHKLLEEVPNLIIPFEPLKKLGERNLPAGVRRKEDRNSTKVQSEKENNSEINDELMPLECYKRIYIWHKQKGEILAEYYKRRLDRPISEDYYYGYKILLNLMPSPENVTEECMFFYFREVIMGYFEWSYHEVDEYGIKISAYAHKGYSYLINKNKWESSKIYDCKIYNTLKEFSKHFLK